MAIELINVGSIANDGTGDDLREAMLKINANFEELDLRDDEQTSASNLGSGAGVFAQKLNYDLQYKSLVAGTDVTISSTDNEITINADGGLKTLEIQGDIGGVVLSPDDVIKIVGTDEISTQLTENTLTIAYSGWKQLSDDPNPVLSSALDAGNNNINNVDTLTANVTTGLHLGNVVGNVYGIDVRDLNLYFDGYYDFGDIGKTYTSIIEWIAESADVDFGTFQNPDPRTIDLGAF